MSTLVVEVIPATLEHAAAMAPRMRQADKDEVWASALLPPEMALSLSIRTSQRAWAGLVNGEVVCLFGVGAPSALSDIGVPWLLGTDDLERYQVPFLRRCRRYVADMIEPYRYLVNYVDDRNTVSQRWLIWLGFTLLPAEPHGPLRQPFRRFYMVKGATDV